MPSEPKGDGEDVKTVVWFLCAVAAASAAEPVPGVQTISGKFERVVVVRLKNGMDMLEGLQKAIASEKIRNAVVLSGHGSVTTYHVHVVENTTLPPKDAFPKGAGAYDLLGAQGHIINGRVHTHITLANTAKVIGGHLEPGTKVFTFAAIALGVLSDDVNLERIDDWTLR